MLIKNRAGFDWGFSSITTQGDAHKSLMNFGVLRLKPGMHYDIGSSLEWACLLLFGELTFVFGNESRLVKRSSFFDEDPKALHLAPKQSGKIIAHEPCEIAVVSTDNHQSFEAAYFDEHNILPTEERGKGILDDCAHRVVRTIFDKRNRPLSNLVLGEVVNLPGRWSSYPPHHHRQPEIYHYRFTEKQGYGHAELDDEVYKIKNYDSLLIPPGHDHAQVSAPGYGMYYVWAIRHLDDEPYLLPTFSKEHAWTKEADADQRVWQRQSTRKI